MRKLLLRMTVATLAASAAGYAYADTKIDVLYAVPSNFRDLQNKLAEEFKKLHPEITVKFRTPADTYDNATAEVLRAKLVGDQPDVLFQGLNQIRVLVDQGDAIALDGFVSKPEEWAALGYIPAMASLGEMNGKKYGLPFAISTPIMYVNEDLLAAAGASADQFPQDWESILALGAKISGKGKNAVGFLYGYDTTGNWGFQSLVTSAGGVFGTPNGCKISFDSLEGNWALGMFEAFSKAGMPSMGWAQGRQAFAAGTLGIFVESSATVALMTKNVGDQFKWRTLPYPMKNKDGKLPAGGTVTMILAKDPEKQKAAWEYVKFVTGPVGQTLMANYTGYAPGNKLAIDDPAMLKDYYAQRPNFATGVNQLSKMTGWYSWAGQNSVKIVDVMQNHINDVVAGRTSAKDKMPQLVGDVQKLLPTACR
jgi:multiple sugar transport system substrate-binding protein